MAQVEIRDRAIWTKHIHGDPALAKQLERLTAGQTVKLRVAGREGVWEKMRTGASGAPTPGLKPVGPMRRIWQELFKSHRGEIVDIALDEAPPPPDVWEGAGDVERKAAWAAFRALSGAGWRSEAVPGGRDELHER